MGIAQRLEDARAKLDEVQSPGYADSLAGMTGAEPAVVAAGGG
jgi:hypothetical protein